MDSKQSKVYYSPQGYWIPRPKFDVWAPNAVHQADLLFLPHDKLPHGHKVFKYALTVVDIASHYKEAEPLTSKDSAEVAKAFQDDLQAQPFDLASDAAGRPWPQVHGKRDTRNGETQNTHSAWTH